MAAEIEWVTGVLRVGGQFEGHGDPYEFSCTVNVRGDEAELIGGCGEITPRMGRDIKAALLAHGITKARWVRVTDQQRDVVMESREDLCFPFGSSEPMARAAANN